MNGSLMTLLEAAEYLQVSKETMYRLVKKNKIPHFKMGRIIRFSKEELNTFTKSKGGTSGKE